MTDSKKYDGSQWEHNLRKLTTATEAVENPLYSDGTAITIYTIKGNEEHTGTPSPQNPVMPNGTGDKTANLSSLNEVNDTITNSYFKNNKLTIIPVTAGTYTISFYLAEKTSGILNGSIGIGTLTDYTYDIDNYPTPDNIPYTITRTFTITQSQIDTYGGYIWARFLRYNSRTDFSYKVTQIMLNTGSTAFLYEPYGYKIPILTTQGSAVNYLGSVQSTRKIKKIVFVGSEDENWSAQSAGGGAMRFRYTISNSVQADTAHPTSICTHLPLGAEGGTWNTDDIYTIASNYLWVRLDSSFTTVALLKSWLAQQYANGTPFTVWYVLATPETGIVNEPLMKIGDYSDSISNAATIPTTEGANSISVGTTIQPSEFSATWTGWHDSSVKEWDGSQWI